MLTIVATLWAWTGGLGPADLDVRRPVAAGPAAAVVAPHAAMLADPEGPEGGRRPRIMATLSEEGSSDDNDDQAAQGSTWWSRADERFYLGTSSPPRHRPSPRPERSPVLRC
jgi:hypothetical protein